jgi:hypothetical protein
MISLVNTLGGNKKVGIISIQYVTRAATWAKGVEIITGY